MKMQAARKMKTRMISFMGRRKIVKRLVKQAVSRAAARKKQIATHHDLQVQQVVEGGLVPGSCGVFKDGEFVPLTSEFLVKAAVPYYIPVIDNHGFLLGQFRKLDDLRILDDESPLTDGSFIQ